MKRDDLAKELGLVKDEYDIKEIESMMPLTEAWLRNMEKKGLIKFKSEKVRGQVKRLFQRADVTNALYLAALRWAGVSPHLIEDYMRQVKRFREWASRAGLYRKPYKTPLDDACLLFDPRDIFPDGDPDNFEWQKIDVELYHDIAEMIQAIYFLAWQVKGSIESAKTLQRVTALLDKNLDEFMTELEKRMLTTVAGASTVHMLKGRR